MSLATWSTPARKRGGFYGLRMAPSARARRPGHVASPARPGAAQGERLVPADLASKIGGDAGQISRYEHGRITPSADVIIRLAEVFDVTTDYLLLDDAARRPRRTPDEAALGDDRIAAVTELSEEDLNLVASFIDALVTKTRLKVLASGS